MKDASHIMLCYFMLKKNRKVYPDRTCHFMYFMYSSGGLWDKK